MSGILFLKNLLQMSIINNFNHTKDTYLIDNVTDKLYLVTN